MRPELVRNMLIATLVAAATAGLALAEGCGPLAALLVYMLSGAVVLILLSLRAYLPCRA